MSAAALLAAIPDSRDHLSTLEFADDNCITYYDGDNPERVRHLTDCTLLCLPSLIDTPDGVDRIPVADPKIAFYELSAEFKIDYLDYASMAVRDGARIHRDAVIPESCTIGPGSVIGACTLGENVRIEANCVVYSRSTIGAGTVIEPNSVIGATGVMWVWANGGRVFLEQLGGVVIEEDCFIGSNVTIVRGSANEMTTIGAGTCMAHGTLIGHGCRIGVVNHFANNVSLGGSVRSGEGCFFGSSSVVTPGKQLCDEVVVGAGAVLAKDATEPGVYTGVPARHTSGIRDQMSGLPKWNR